MMLKNLLVTSLGCLVLGGCAASRESFSTRDCLRTPLAGDATLRVIDWRYDRVLKFYTFKYNPSTPWEPCRFTSETSVPADRVVCVRPAGPCGNGHFAMTQVRLRHDWEQ